MGDSNIRFSRAWEQVKKHKYVSGAIPTVMVVLTALRIVGDAGDAMTVAGWITKAIEVMGSNPVLIAGGIVVLILSAYIFQDIWMPVFRRPNRAERRRERVRKTREVFRVLSGQGTNILQIQNDDEIAAKGKEWRDRCAVVIELAFGPVSKDDFMQMGKMASNCPYYLDPPPPQKPDRIGITVYTNRACNAVTTLLNWVHNTSLQANENDILQSWNPHSKQVKELVTLPTLDTPHSLTQSGDS